MSIFGRDDEPRSQKSQPQKAQSREAGRQSASRGDVAKGESPPRPSPARPSAGSTAAGHTVISAGTEIEGEISGATDVVIEGSLEGRVSVGSLVTVGKEGRVRGEIRAESISVAGKVFGNIVGKDKVDIHSTGKLEGDVKAPRVSIADGAYFKGRVEMIGATATGSKPASGKESAASASSSARPNDTAGGSKAERQRGPGDEPSIRPASATKLDEARASESAK